MSRRITTSKSATDAAFLEMIGFVLLAIFLFSCSLFFRFSFSPFHPSIHLLLFLLAISLILYVHITQDELTAHYLCLR